MTKFSRDRRKTVKLIKHRSIRESQIGWTSNNSINIHTQLQTIGSTLQKSITKGVYKKDSQKRKEKGTLRIIHKQRYKLSHGNQRPPKEVRRTRKKKDDEYVLLELNGYKFK